MTNEHRLLQFDMNSYVIIHLALPDAVVNCTVYGDQARRHGPVDLDPPDAPHPSPGEVPRGQLHIQEWVLQFIRYIEAQKLGVHSYSKMLYRILSGPSEPPEGRRLHRSCPADRSVDCVFFHSAADEVAAQIR
jgi:hypothetical protein